MSMNARSIFAAILVALLPVSAQAAGRPVSAEDLFKISYVGQPQISPDGKYVVYVVSKMNGPQDRYDTNLWMTDVATGRSTQITRTGRDNGPTWSPDSAVVAFVRSMPKSKSQIYTYTLGTKAIKQAFETGRGSIVMQGRPTIEPYEGGRNQIIITELPYQVIKSRLHEQIADLAKQKKVEGMNFDARKHVVEYDDVMNTQRQIIYGEREKVLQGADTRENIDGYMRELIEKGVEVHCQGRHPENWELDGLIEYLSHYFPIPPDTAVPEQALRGGRPGLIEFLHGAAREAYAAKEASIGSEELMRSVERFVLLRTIDQKWIDYLTQMEHFREGIGLRAYGQRDPLVEYKNEAFQMFNDLTEAIQADIVTNMFRVQVMAGEPPPQAPSVLDGQGPRNGSGPGEPVGVGAPGQAKLGRNDPCWCGSGKKYKRCHGR